MRPAKVPGEVVESRGEGCGRDGTAVRKGGKKGVIEYWYEVLA